MTVSGMKRSLTIGLALWAALLPRLALATQNELVPPTAGIFTGVQFSQKIGDAFRSLASCNKGSTAPANVNGAAVDGLCWIDDSVSPNIVKRYINGGWAIESYLDPTATSSVGVIGGGIATINSAFVTDLSTVPQANITIHGTTSIFDLGAVAAGIVKVIRFDGALILQNSNQMAMPCGVDFTTANGDRAVVTSMGSAVWEFTSYTRANGVPIDCAAVGKPDFTFSANVPALHLAADGSAVSRSTFPVYLAAVTRVQNGTRTSGNATITGVGNTIGFGVGMPVESTGVGAGCTIASIVANTSITLNSSGCVTASGTSAVTVFLTGYGAGGNSTTVGLPDCQGRGLAGLDNNVGRMTAAVADGDPNAFNSGVGFQSVTMALGNMIQHNHPVFLNDPGHGHPGSVGTTQGVTTPGNVSAAAMNGNNGTGGTNNQALTIANNGTGITVRDTAGGAGTANQTANAGSASPTPLRTVPPALMAHCVVRVTP